ncbi:MAG: helix-turn-helix transcriptional regulator [Lachnospiraceae bacterium]|nr:helix-turn-helix transcriptional regulator [Lachnospiraceae bacterium]
MTVAENIKRIRTEKGLTQKQLGEKCGMSESTLRQYELGFRNPKIETIRKIAVALDCTISDIDENFFILPTENVNIESGLLTEVDKIFRKYESSGTFTKEEQNILIKYKKELKKLERRLKHLKSIEDKNEEERKITIKKLNELQIGVPDFLKRNDGKYIIIDSDNPEEELLLDDYRGLNEIGQLEARKRVSELTEIPRYTKPDEPPQD